MYVCMYAGGEGVISCKAVVIAAPPRLIQKVYIHILGFMCRFCATERLVTTMTMYVILHMKVSISCEDSG
jgi:hypothetical protein